jgi:stearoyl-CoA desaturase (delta-9 desaturase)
VLSLILFAIFYPLSMIGVEAGLHRYFSHRAFKCGRALRIMLGIMGSLAGQGPVLFWAATHRRHHRFSDTHDDPHAPLEPGLSGLWHAHVGWLFDEHASEPGREAPDLARDGATVLVHRLYPLWFLLGLLIPAAIGLIAGGAHGALEGFLWGGLVRVFAVHHMTWSVNSLCHLVGTRPYGSRDRSRNIAALALPTMGGAWHNNHHAYPTAATTAHRWWQVDPSGWFIHALAAIRLAWDVRGVPTRDVRAARFMKAEAQ